MSVPQKTPESGWVDALARAVRRLEGATEEWLIFLEDREDARVEVASSGGSKIAHTRLRGVSVRTGLDPAHSWHRSDPGPEDLDRLAATAASGNELDNGGSGTAAAGSGQERLTSGGSLGWLERMVEAVSSSGMPGQAEITAKYVGFSQEVRIAHPERQCEDRREGRRVRLEVRLVHGGKSSLAVAERVLGRGPEAAEAESLVEEVTRRAEERLGAGTVQGGHYPVVFGPGVGGILLHEVVGHALEADTVQRGGSLLSRLTGPIATSDLVVLDDPRRARAPWVVDDEGQEPKPTPLLRRGRVAGLLHDLRSARRAGGSPTGHGRRASFREPVRPRMGCTFLAAGELEPEEVLDRIASGIYVRRMETGAVDPASGEASFRVTDADAITAGEIAGPLEPFVLRIETQAMLSSLDRIANDLAFDVCVGSCLRDGQPLATSVGAPTFRVGLATVVG